MDEKLAELLREVELTHQQLKSAEGRLADIRETYRRERDGAIHAAVDYGGREAKRQIIEIIHATPQWLNKLLRGEAYRRQND